MLLYPKCNTTKHFFKGVMCAISFFTLQTTYQCCGNRGVNLQGVVWIVGHQTSFPSEPVCYLSLETVFKMFHSVLLVAEITDARLAQTNGTASLPIKTGLPTP